MFSHVFALISIDFDTIIQPGWGSLVFRSNLAQAISFDGLRHAQSCAVIPAKAVYEWRTRATAAAWHWFSSIFIDFFGFSLILTDFHNFVLFLMHFH